jgi:alginate O-acetyltransferase complex protein AlgJ
MHKRWGWLPAGIFFLALFAAAGSMGILAAIAPALSRGQGLNGGAGTARSTGADDGSAIGAAGSAGTGVVASAGSAGFRSRALSLIKGKTQAAFQERFDKTLALRAWAVSALAEARWAIFGQGYPGVLVGEDAWLFSTEEFEGDLGYLDEDITAFVAKARDALRARGIALLMLPLPAKARIYYRALPAGLRPAHEERYASLLAAFSSQGLPAVDLADAYLSRLDGPELFLRGDTHWSPEGARVAAELTAAAIKALPEARDLPVSGYWLRESGSKEYRGDLLAFLPARGAPWRPLPPPELLRGFELLSGEAAGPLDAAALFGAQSIPVALVGTSYSASPNWRFEDFLKAELSCDVLNLSAEGAGPFKPLLDALGGSALEENGVRVLVWELPERYVPGDFGVSGS